MASLISKYIKRDIAANHNGDATAFLKTLMFHDSEKQLREAIFAIPSVVAANFDNILEAAPNKSKRYRTAAIIASRAVTYPMLRQQIGRKFMMDQIDASSFTQQDLNCVANSPLLCHIITYTHVWYTPVFTKSSNLKCIMHFLKEALLTQQRSGISRVQELSTACEKWPLVVGEVTVKMIENLECDWVIHWLNVISTPSMIAQYLHKNIRFQPATANYIGEMITTGALTGKHYSDDVKRMVRILS